MTTKTFDNSSSVLSSTEIHVYKDYLDTPPISGVYIFDVEKGLVKCGMSQNVEKRFDGEIEMETDGIIEMFGLTLRTFGTKKGVKDLNQIRLMVTDDAMWKLRCASFEARCSVGELCNAIIMQWLSEHEAEIKKD